MLIKRNLLSAAIASAVLLTASGMCESNANASSATGQHAQRKYTSLPQSAVRPTAPDNQQVAQNQKKKKAAARREKSEAQQKKMAAQLGAIEVTGFAASLQNSTAIKRDSNSIVEAVSAEQIGKLPGTSIADTLGRLPGLAVQTVNGRPQVLSIHGLGPDFSTALLNGNEQASTANNRDVRFDQYPSSWFGSVVVHMTPSASLIGQGLAGTVDLHTIRPLNQSGRHVAFNARYIRDGMSQLAPGSGVSDDGYHVNGVYVNQFANHTFGITIGADVESDPAQIESQNNGLSAYSPGPNGNLIVGDSKDYGISDQLKRYALLVTLQWQPSEHFSSTFDTTYSRFRETQQLKGAEFPLWTRPGVTVEPDEIENGFVVSGVFHNVGAVIRNDYNKTNASVWNIDWKNTVHFNANWSAQFGANYSRAERTSSLWENYSGTGPIRSGPLATIAFKELPDGRLYLNPEFDYSGPGLVITDPQGWGSGATPPLTQTGFLNQPKIDDYLDNLHLSVTRSFLSGPFASVQFGVDRKTRDKTYNIGQDFVILKGNAKSGPIPTNHTVADPLAFMGVGPQLIYDPFSMLNSGEQVLFSTVLSSISVPPNWHVRERDLVSYVQFNLDTAIGGIPLRGNFGVQAVHTNQSSSGQSATLSLGGTNGQAHVRLIPTSGGAKYTRWLPSVNLVFSLSPNDDLRVSAAKTLARARMDQMNASTGISTDIQALSSTNPNIAFFSASGGNPQLRPTKANNYNVSYEHYFSGPGLGYECSAGGSKASALCAAGAGHSGGYIALSAYFLSLHDYIDPNAAFLKDFSAFIPAYLSAAQQKQLGTPLGIVSGPTNDGHGYVKGAQASLNLPLGDIARPLRDFGVLLSADYTKSSVVLGANPIAIPVPGLSKWVTDATLYYHSHGFQARVIRTHRSNFLGRVSGISATRLEEVIKGGETYSAQVSYTFSTGPAKGLSIILQGSNLTDRHFVTFLSGHPREVQTWQDYGRSYELGVSYRF